MTAIGGSIQEVTLNGRIFAVAADADVTRKIGGFENEVMSNGDGGARMIKTRVPMQLNGLVLEVDDERGDQEFLQQISDANDYVPISITYASGDTSQGTGTIVGEFQYSSQSATATVNLSGPGALTIQ